MYVYMHVVYTHGHTSQFHARFVTVNQINGRAAAAVSAVSAAAAAAAVAAVVLLSLYTLSFVSRNRCMKKQYWFCATAKGIFHFMVDFFCLR